MLFASFCPYFAHLNRVCRFIIMIAVLDGYFSFFVRESCTSKRYCIMYCPLQMQQMQQRHHQHQHQRHMVITMATLMMLLLLDITVMAQSINEEVGPSLSDLQSSIPVVSTRRKLELNLSPEEKAFQTRILENMERKKKVQKSFENTPSSKTSVSLNVSELRKYDGSNNNLPIYVSIRKRIYDVTAGSQYYAQGEKYSYLSGREVARGMGTGCFESTGFTHDLRGLTEKQLSTIDHWGSFYKKKYFLAGYLITPKLLPDREEINDNCEEASRYGGRPGS